MSDPRDETAAAAAFAYEQAGEYLAGLDERPVLPQGVDDAVARFGGPFPEQLPEQSARLPAEEGSR